MSAGIVCGYCIIWGEESGNLSVPGETPCYDRIAPRSISIAATARANFHHFRQTAFASIANKTLELDQDNIGIWFQAEIPNDAPGYDLRNGLAGGRWLAISPELEGITKHLDPCSGAHVITRASLTGFAVVQRGSALFAGTRAWLAGDFPNDPQAAALHDSFAVRKRRRAEPVAIPPMPQAMKKAMAMMGRR
jgi:Caudovirus prohead serine protease